MCVLTLSAPRIERKKYLSKIYLVNGIIWHQINCTIERTFRGSEFRFYYTIKIRFTFHQHKTHEPREFQQLYNSNLSWNHMVECSMERFMHKDYRRIWFYSDDWREIFLQQSVYAEKFTSVIFVNFSNCDTLYYLLCS